MTMMKRTAALVLFVVGGFSAHAAGSMSGNAGRNAVIVELFTSQGCSSCPPADRVLSALGRDKSDGVTIIPLAFHVDYWNSIGWADPFSSSRWSARQNAYAAAMHSSQVYTPQLLVNGRAQFVGSDEQRIRAEIASQSRLPARGSVLIEGVKRGVDAVRVDVTASIGSEAGNADAEVYVVIFESGITTAVPRGENSGRRLANDFIVRSMTPAFSVRSGQPALTRTVTVPIAAAWKPENLGVAAFVQDRASLSINGGSARPVIMPR